MHTHTHAGTHAARASDLLRTDRMTMAHGLEARVPFLDLGHVAAAQAVHPRRKLYDAEAAAASRSSEKAFLRRAFERPHGGVTIPAALLWRQKAMQCEGVGEGWVAALQACGVCFPPHTPFDPTPFPHTRANLT